MYLKSITLFSFLAFISIGSLMSQASEFQVTSGEVIKTSFSFTSLNFSTNTEDGGLIIARNKYKTFFGKKSNNYTLEHYDNEMKLIESVPFGEDNSYIMGMEYVDGRVYIIQCEENNAESSFDYSVMASDLSEIDFQKEKLFSVDKSNLRGSIVTNDHDHERLGIVKFSSNKKYFSILLDLKDSKAKHQIFVYNLDFEKIIDQTLEIDNYDIFFKYITHTLDNNDGSVYFIGKYYYNEKAFDWYDKEINIDYRLFRVGSVSIGKTRIADENFLMKDMRVFVSDSGVHCLAPYSEKHRAKTIGFAYFRFDKYNLDRVVEKRNPLTKQLYLDAYGYHNGPRKYKQGNGFSNVLIREFLESEQGDLYFTSEVFNTYSSEYRTEYFYRDIFIGKLSMDGSAEWMRAIDKNQSAENFINYYSYNSLNNNGNLYLILNAKKVKELKGGKLVFKSGGKNKMNTYILKFNPRGELKYDVLVNSDEKYTFRTLGSRANNVDKSIVSFGQKGNKYKIIKFDLLSDKK